MPGKVSSQAIKKGFDKPFSEMFPDLLLRIIPPPDRFKIGPVQIPDNIADSLREDLS